MRLEVEEAGNTLILSSHQRQVTIKVVLINWTRANRLLRAYWPIDLVNHISRHVVPPLRLDRFIQRYVSVVVDIVRRGCRQERGAGQPHDFSPTTQRSRKRQRDTFSPPRRRPHGETAAPAAQTIVAVVGVG